MKPEKFAEMIKPIITSPDISVYEVGHTQNSSDRRRNYQGEDWPYFYIIETDLTQKMSSQLKQQYFEYLTDQDKGSLFYKKYHPEKRDKPFKEGGLKKTDSDTKEYSIYIACKAKT